MAAKAFGADSVAITDLKNDNLALAEQLGADICLNPKASATPAEVGEWLKASLPPYGPDVVIDCAGFESTLQVRCHCLPLRLACACADRVWASQRACSLKGRGLAGLQRFASLPGGTCTCLQCCAPCWQQLAPVLQKLALLRRAARGGLACASLPLDCSNIELATAEALA